MIDIQSVIQTETTVKFSGENNRSSFHQKKENIKIMKKSIFSFKSSSAIGLSKITRI